MLTGDLIDGKQAFEWGLAPEVAPLAKTLRSRNVPGLSALSDNLDAAT